MSQHQLSQLVVQVARSNLTSPEIQELVRTQILGARQGLEHAPPELMGCLEAAATLIRSMPHLLNDEAEDLRAMIVRLVQLVANHESLAKPKRSSVIRGTQKAKEAAPAPATPAPEAKAEEELSPVGLRVIHEMMLGEVLVQLGVATTQQIDQALAAMASSGKKLGETLLELGTCKNEDIEEALTMQRALSKASSRRKAKIDPGAASKTVGTVDGVLLGEVLIHYGRIDRNQLEEGLALQRERGGRLGEALVELGYVTWEDVRRSVEIQQDGGPKGQSDAEPEGRAA